MRALVLLGACAALLCAQTPTASLTGEVVDATGGVVPEAAVTVRNVESNRERRVQTNASGSFVLTNLAPGRYDLTVEHSGFRRLQQKGLTLQVDQAARLRLTLEVGAVVETVEVTASAPLLNTENQVKGEVISNLEIVEMPLLSRDYSNLAYLVPGVGRPAESSVGGAFAVSGVRPENTNYLVDGLSAGNHRDGGATATPPLEAMQEFKMQTSTYSAEYGRLAGGVMSMALKTGGNALHGSLFEFVRNDAFDARNFFDRDKSKLRRHQFGANLTGPVRIPGVYDGRNRTFFLASWDALRQLSGSPRLGRVPSEPERAGDFSDSRDALGRVIAITDPFVKAPFPGNKIPASMLHPMAQKIVDYYPLPNQPGQANNFWTNQNAVGDNDAVLVKIDQKLFASDTLSVRFLKRYNRGKNPYFGSNLGKFGSVSDPTQTVAGLTYTRLFRPNVVNEFRMGLSRLARQETLAHGGRNYAAEIGLPSSVQPSQYGFPYITVRDLVQLGDHPNLPVRIAVNSYEWADTLTWVTGRHVIKTGINIMRQQNFQASTTNNVRGTLNFLGRWTNQPVADFMLGLMENSTKQGGRVSGYMFSNSIGLFVQDDFKVKPHLTLNLGLRWEILQPPSEKYGRIASFIPELGRMIVADDRNIPGMDERVAAAGLQDRFGLARGYGLPQALVDSQTRNIGPRLGFAWRPNGNTRTVLRGGYGLFYGTSIAEATRSDMTTNFPLTMNQSYNRVATDPTALTLADPFPTTRLNLVGITNAFGQQWHAAPQYVQSWNLTVERAVTGTTALEIGYVGTKGTHLSRKYDVNQPFRVPEMQLPNGSFPRPYTGLGAINYYTYDANSIYNSLAVTLRRAFSRGFFYRIGYVYGKAIDDSSQVWGNSKGGYPGVQDARNFSLERARSDFDTGHSVVIAGSYEVPRSMNRLLRGWQLSGTGRMYTGQPFTVRVSNVNLELGEANRPDRVGNGRLENASANRWFDLSAFVPVARNSYRFGDSGRNILDGPGFFEVNLALSKRFRIAESHSVQFRWEAFNAINRTNLKLPENMVNSPNVGTIISANQARIMQFGLRYEF